MSDDSEKKATNDGEAPVTPASAGSYRSPDTSLENMMARGMIDTLRRVADDMEETGDKLQACEDLIALEGAFSKGSEIKGAADMAREWALHIETIYFPANAEGHSSS